ncbi:MAG: hypothetical protein HQL37_13170 [Alphaproteobacteria bacterium]|nr:hypothetical protein [Alphaproteobacteria bacterium]
MTATAAQAASDQVAEARTQKEDLVYTDPTVPQPGKWLVGANAEDMFVVMNYDSKSSLVTNSGITTATTTSTVIGNEVGGTFTAGYGNLWGFITYRVGEFGGTRDYSSSLGYKEDYSVQTSQIETRLRYLVPELKFWGITPFVIGGYNYTNVDSSLSIETPRISFGGKTSLLRWNDEYHSFFGGLGGIAPFTESLGLRADASAAYVRGSGSYKAPFTTANTWSGNGYGGEGHVTLYYKISDTWTAQLGAKGEFVTGDSIDAFGAFGAYANLGYTVHF